MPRARRTRSRDFKLAAVEASRTWTVPIAGWKAALNHYAIVFQGRMPDLDGN
jgi:putative transposase